MKAAYRTFAYLLGLLFVSVALSLAGSWQLRYRLDPISAIDTRTTPPDEVERLQEKQLLRTWTTLAQVSSLGLCAILCGFGLHIRRRATREALGKQAAEQELDRERRALERRIEERTRELRQEVEDRRRAEEFNRGQKQVLEMLASPAAQPTEEILRHLAATVASQRRTWECAIHLMDEEHATLNLVASSQVSDRLERYLAAIGRDFPDAPESRACILDEPCIVEKMTEVRRPWSELLVANSIYSAWSVPFRTDASGEIAGTFTVYSRLEFVPSQRDIELVETAAKLATVVIEHRRIHAELVDNAYRDALTGLPNRRAGERAIESAVQRASSRNETLAVVWIDLDRFKRVNDQHGHEAGDYVLRTVADRIRKRPESVGTAARMGGDEFLVLLPGKDAAAATDLSRHLIAAINEPITFGTRTFSVSASIGISVFPRDGLSIERLQRNADTAMYRAKSAGSGACIYSPAMNAEVEQHLELEEALAAAVEKNYLWIAYQPVYASHGRLLGFEALLRFRHPVLGDIPPSRFIPVAEETRRIGSIGAWTLRETCRQMRAWRTAGLPWVKISVNISAIQFAVEDFAQSVAQILAENKVPGEYLTLELTESVVMGDNRAVVRQMNLLKSHGVRIAIDDFGTGYSSLSYLHKLPIDILKIDRSFVERLLDAEGTRPIVEAIIAMAHHLGVVTVAEGVETSFQHQILTQAGCDAVQGFLFARPMPSDEAQTCLVNSLSLPFANASAVVEVQQRTAS